MFRNDAVLARVLLPALAAVVPWVLLRCVPFELFSCLTGIVLALLAIAALFKPNRWLWLPTRTRACLASCTGGWCVSPPRHASWVLSGWVQARGEGLWECDSERSLRDEPLPAYIRA
jgi:hypothetical protein